MLKNNSIKFVNSRVLAFALVMLFIYVQSAQAFAKSCKLIDNKLFDKKIKIGYQELEQGNYDKAAKTFNNLLVKYGDSYQPHLGLAKIYLEKNDYINAQKQLEIVQKQNPKCSDAAYELANVYESNQEWQKAINEFELFMNISPQDARDRFIALRIKYLKDNLIKQEETK